MKSLKNYVCWYFHKHWSRWDIFWASFQIAVSIFVVSLPNTYLISTVVIVISLSMLMYSMGRRHQSEMDLDLTRETAALARDTARMLAECQIMEMWYFDMRPDPQKPTRMVIHSRVCPN